MNRFAVAALIFFGMGAAPFYSFAQTPGVSGEYIFNLAGCEGCHTDKATNGPRLAGGRAFKTDFGTFYSPNITPDVTTGIGLWMYSDFETAMRKGRAPNGSHYFPAFPYTSYTKMTDEDLKALWDYLKAQPSVTQTNKKHELSPPFGWRWTVRFWNWLYLDTGPETNWNRGRYIAEALSHCHECHTPRGSLGGRDDAMAYGGTKRNPEGITVPNITPDPETGIGKWRADDYEMLLTIGMLPDGDFVGGVMGESVSHSTSKMTPKDRAALIEYLMSRPAIYNPVQNKKLLKNQGSEW